uniref:Putative secreted protein n=1 Tax=Amblyomma triste TaxID=251400 RepID=A0A023G222_AMBTT
MKMKLIFFWNIQNVGSLIGYYSQTRIYRTRIYRILVISNSRNIPLKIPCKSIGKPRHISNSISPVVRYIELCTTHWKVCLPQRRSHHPWPLAACRFEATRGRNEGTVRRRLVWAAPRPFPKGTRICSCHCQ